jgi:hypothetical protein
MQHTDEAIARRDIREGLFRVHGLQAVDDVCEGEGAVNGFGSGVV